MKKVLEGNHAISWGVQASDVKVIAAYPITPQTQIVEMLSEMCSAGPHPRSIVKISWLRHDNFTNVFAENKTFRPEG